MSRYIVEHRCVKCGHKFSNRDMIHSDGVCPYCGNISRGTICDSDKVAVEVKGLFELICKLLK